MYPRDRLKQLTFVLFVLMVVAHPARGETIFSTFGDEDVVDLNGGATIRTRSDQNFLYSQSFAQAFMVPEDSAYYLDSLEVAVQVWAGDNRARFGLYGDLDGLPDEPLAETLITVINERGSAEAVQSFAFDTQLLLEPGRTYWVVGSSPNPDVFRMPDTVRWLWGGPGISGTFFRRFEFSGFHDMWFEVGVGHPLSLRVTATPVPECGSLFPLLLGFVYLTRRLP